MRIMVGLTWYGPGSGLLYKLTRLQDARGGWNKHLMFWMASLHLTILCGVSGVEVGRESEYNGLMCEQIRSYRVNVVVRWTSKLFLGWYQIHDSVFGEIESEM